MNNDAARVLDALHPHWRTPNSIDRRLARLRARIKPEDLHLDRYRPEVIARWLAEPKLPSVEQKRIQQRPAKRAKAAA